MGLRTPQQYIESIRDDRTVYYRGERVADVTTHSVISKAVHHAALDFEMAENPEYGNLAIVN